MEHPRAALRVVGITIAGTLIYYVWISYMPGFAHTATGIPLRDALLANTIAVAVLPVPAAVRGAAVGPVRPQADACSRSPSGFVVIAYPAFLLIELGGFWPLLVVELVGVTFLAGYSANCAVVMAEQFPAEVRSTGIGLPYALAVALFGGTAPYITTWMSTNGFGGFVWLYVAAAGLVGVVVYALMPETARTGADVSPRHVVVTGAAGGIGLAVAEAFAAAGRHRDRRGRPRRRAPGRDGDRPTRIVADLGDERCAERHRAGRPTRPVRSTSWSTPRASTPRRRSTHMTAAAWDRVQQVNVRAPVLLTVALARAGPARPPW